MGASAPASEKWPSGTLMQSAALSWYQASSCAGRYCPASHGLQKAGDSGRQREFVSRTGVFTATTHEQETLGAIGSNRKS